jgi:hypothetical protein
MGAAFAFGGVPSQTPATTPNTFSTNLDNIVHEIDVSGINQIFNNEENENEENESPVTSTQRKGNTAKAPTNRKRPHPLPIDAVQVVSVLILFTLHEFSSDN